MCWILGVVRALLRCVLGFPMVNDHHIFPSHADHLRPVTSEPLDPLQTSAALSLCPPPHAVEKGKQRPHDLHATPPDPPPPVGLRRPLRRTEKSGKLEVERSDSLISACLLSAVDAERDAPHSAECEREQVP